MKKHATQKNLPSVSLIPILLTEWWSGLRLFNLNVQKILDVWWKQQLLQMMRWEMSRTAWMKMLMISENSSQKFHKISMRLLWKLLWVESKQLEMSLLLSVNSSIPSPKIWPVNHNALTIAQADIHLNKSFHAFQDVFVIAQSHILSLRPSQSSLSPRSDLCNALSMPRTRCSALDQTHWSLQKKSNQTTRASSSTPILSPSSVFSQPKSSSAWGFAAGLRFKYKTPKKKPSDSRRTSISFSTSFINKWQRKSKQSTLLTEKREQEWEEHLADQVRRIEEAKGTFTQMHKMKLKL